MKLSAVLTVLAIAATSVANPVVLPRTGSVSCGQNNGIEACCGQKNQKKTKSEIQSLFKNDPVFGGLLTGLLSNLIPGLLGGGANIPVDVPIALSCINVLAIQGGCKNSQVCCFTNKQATTETNSGGSGGLINILNNNNINLCPNIQAV